MNQHADHNHDMSEEEFSSDIAIIGLAGRFPGADDIKSFWNNLAEGVESIVQFSDEDLAEAGVSPAQRAASDYVAAGAPLDDIDLFDAGFFGVSPAEATLMDPQIRIFLETAWLALENAGYDPSRYEGRAGVFGGMSMGTYLHRLIQAGAAAKTADNLRARILNDKDFLSTWVSYKLDLKGPAVNVQNACSTSLIAVHMAVQSILAQECDMALAGGVAVDANQKAGYVHYEGGIHSADGHCRAFDAEAGGTVNGCGAGIVVLKKLDNALADGDRIIAVIKGTAINNDGSNKVGFTAPSVEGQAEVIAEALAIADVDPETVTMIEAHGTGTPMGDPVEITALKEAYGKQSDAPYTGIGSVKTNIGHLDAAAGVAGLIKAALSIENGLMPPNLHFKEANPRLGLEGSPFYINAEAKTWDTGEEPRRAGVSSFGVGGTNAHAIIEQAPEQEALPDDQNEYLLTLSARDPEALKAMTAALADHLNDSSVSLADAAYTLHLGRHQFNHRIAVACTNHTDAIAGLQKAVAAQADAENPAQCIFILPGQGSQHLNMGQALYQREPVYRETVDQCFAILKDEHNLDLKTVLYPETQSEQAADTLRQTRYAQPAIFTASVALARLLQSWGVQPSALLGHSIGEYAAAHLAGAISLENALRLVVARAQLMNRLSSGAMLAVTSDEQSIKARLPQNLDIAAVNGAAQVVVSGEHQAIKDFEAALKADGVSCRALATSHAFHSSMMDPVLSAFADVVKTLEFNDPEIPYISNVTGRWITSAEIRDPQYWVNHLRGTVRFHDGVKTLLEDRADRLFVDLGPGGSLGKLVRRTEGADASRIFNPLPAEKKADQTNLQTLKALGGLWTMGASIDWKSFHPQQRQRVELPGYAFQRRRYWAEPETSTTVMRRRDDVTDWFYLPSWKMTPSVSTILQPSDTESWLIFNDESGLADQLSSDLRASDQDVINVSVASAYARLDLNRFAIRPGAREDYIRMFDILAEEGRMPARIAHLWNIGEDNANARQMGFDSLIYLAQALGSRRINGNVHIAAVATGLFQITGDETILPAKSLLLGPCKVIGFEYANLTCRALDVTPNDPSLSNQIIAELLAEGSERVVAWRGQRRWVQALENHPVTAQEIEAPQSVFITGGTGGVGLAIAEDLASRGTKNIALAARTALPARDQWETWLADDAASNSELLEDSIRRDGTALRIDRAAQTLSGAEARIEQELGMRDLADHDGLEDALNGLCAALIFDYFAQTGVDVSEGSKTTLAQLKQSLGLLSRFDRFLEFFLDTLHEDGLLQLDGDAITFADTKHPLRQLETVKSDFVQRFAFFAPVVDLLAHCASHYGPALSGGMEAIGVLYPEGRSHLLEETMTTIASYSNGHVYERLGRELIEEVRNQAPGRKLRILEVGGGNGNLTKILTHELPGRDIEYFFTDLGKTFVDAAAKRHGLMGDDHMNFHVFDITRDGAAQGLPAHGFDLIFGLDVVHATRDLSVTVGNLRNLLAPNGMLALVESVRLQRWADMVWGLADGWWHYEDTDRRNKSPLMPIADWERLFDDVGFDQTVSFPREQEKRPTTRFSLIVGQQPELLDAPAYREQIAETHASRAAKTASQIRRIRRIEAQGAEVKLLSADVSSQKSLRAAIDQTKAEFGGLNGLIHAAGQLADGLIQRKGESAVATVFGPKVEGAQHLDAILEDGELDWVVLCSSLTSVLGNISQVDHTAANAFMDAFAAARSGSKTRWLSINWGVWNEVGAVAEHQDSAGFKDFMEESREQGMSTREGVDAFRRALSINLPQVAVSPVDLEAQLKTSLEFRPGEDSGMELTRSAELQERPALDTEYVAPADALEEWLAERWQDQLGFSGLGVNDNFFELGGDSLLGISLVNRLQRELGEIVHITALLDAPSIKELGDYLSEHYPEAVARLSGEEVASEETHEQLTELHAAQFEAIIRPENVPSGSPASALKPAAFVLSPPRTGSTLLRVMLAGNPHLFAPPEMELLPFATLADRKAALVQDKSLLEGLTEAVINLRGLDASGAEALIDGWEREGRGMDEIYAALQEWLGERTLIEKSPSYALDRRILDRAELLFDQPRYVHLTRHPYGMIHSYEEARLDLLFRSDMRARLPFNRRQIAELTWLISEANIKSFLADVPESRHMLLRFEDLLSDPETHMRRVSEFLGVPYDAGMLEPYREKQQRMTGGVHEGSRSLGDVKFANHKGIDSGVAERWRERFTEDFIGVPTLDLAAEYGYAPIAAPAQPESEDIDLSQALENIDDLGAEDVDAMLAQMLAGEGE